MPSHGYEFSHHVGLEELRGHCASLKDTLWVKSMGAVMGNFIELAVFRAKKAYKDEESPYFHLKK